MGFYVYKSLADYTIVVDGWFDLSSTLPDIFRSRLILLQRKGSATLTVAPTHSAEPPTEGTGVVLSTREKLTFGAPHIWVKGKGAVIGLALCERA